MKLISRRNYSLIIIATSFILLGAAIWSFQTHSQKCAVAAEKVTLGTLSTQLSSLIWVAKSKGYFAEQSLDVDIKLYESGLAAFNDMLAGNVEFATADEFVAVRQILEGSDVRIISSIDEAGDVKVVSRRDHGITKITDLKGKRIGLVQGTIAEVFLNLLLLLRKIPPQDVRTVDLSPSEQLRAITKGEVDAVIIWEPDATKVKNELGSNAMVWDDFSGQEYYWLLLAKNETIKRRPLAVQRLLRALISAENFILTHTSDAQSIIAQHSGSQGIHSLPNDHVFSANLDRPLIVAMEAQARWMKSKSPGGQSHLPDFLDFIYFDALEAVKPEGVRIIH
jgi:ABC-type nitrate/sulfonate/bicarbonate transport system substrate-binding protein